MEDPQGCPGCNPDGILPKLDAEGLLAFEVTEGEDAIPCKCGRKWVVMPQEEMIRGKLVD